MSQKIVFATNNRHKIEEVQLLLKDCYKIISPEELGFRGDIPETSSTLEGNALQKARFVYYQLFHLPCFADDTGLEVEALGGAPGVYSARYAGDDKNSDSNIVKLLDELSDKDNRKARFRCVIAYIDGNGAEYLYEGIVNGTILREKCGEKGFGYDPVFCPDGYDITFAQMTLADKNLISHRGLAIRKFTEALGANFRAAR
ncbi:MAG: RdgB/HAM1 family non-canonical purine NTP pyrophosphatase [Prevotellaceae bacterium]|jgi:XTP/dITP diphosphohydrolase|nr:RdgB/HAM1 family non-canonical purine NTP pyrophosphatase [Prevotellaceae bacterium]